MEVFSDAAAPDLGADSDTISNLEFLHVPSNTNHLSCNLMANDERELAIAPPLLQGVDIRAADAAMHDGDLDVIVLKWLRPEWLHLEVGKVLHICKQMMKNDAEASNGDGIPMSA